VVVTLPVNVVVPPASVVKLVSGVVAPTVEMKRVAPVLFAVNAWAPSTAPVKVMSPAPTLIVRSPLSEVAPVMLTALFVVVRVKLAPMARSLV